MENGTFRLSFKDDWRTEPGAGPVSIGVIDGKSLQSAEFCYGDWHYWEDSRKLEIGRQREMDTDCLEHQRAGDKDIPAKVANSGFFDYQLSDVFHPSDNEFARDFLENLSDDCQPYYLHQISGKDPNGMTHQLDLLKSEMAQSQKLAEAQLQKLQAETNAKIAVLSAGGGGGGVQKFEMVGQTDGVHVTNIASKRQWLEMLAGEESKIGSHGSQSLSSSEMVARRQGRMSPEAIKHIDDLVVFKKDLQSTVTQPLILRPWLDGSEDWKSAPISREWCQRLSCLLDLSSEKSKGTSAISFSEACKKLAFKVNTSGKTQQQADNLKQEGLKVCTLHGLDISEIKSTSAAGESQSHSKGNGRISYHRRENDECGPRGRETHERVSDVA
jgi:hypothetical protein